MCKTVFRPPGGGFAQITPSPNQSYNAQCPSFPESLPMDNPPASSRQLRKSQRYFTKLSLAFYDLVLYHFVSKQAWGVSTAVLDQHYARFVSGNHLEVGVGTGFLLDRVSFPQPQPRLVLMDFSTSCLEKTGKRVARYQPQAVQQNILQPVAANLARFDSIAINYVLHCVPGNFREKGIAFANLSPLLNDNGVLFGSTVLAKGVPRNRLAKILLWLFNFIGVFINAGDSPDDLSAALHRNFAEVDLRVTGCTALFSARKPFRTAAASQTANTR